MATRNRSIDMKVVVYGSDGSGGPGTPKMDLTPDILNLGYSGGMSIPGQCVFTLSRNNPKIASIAYGVDHIKVWRYDDKVPAGQLVFSGKIVIPQFGPTDVIVTAWDYVAYLQRSRTGYRVTYPEKKIGTEIIQPEWNSAKTADRSPLAFVTTGTIQNPLADDAVTPVTVNNQFGVVLFDRLFLFFSLAEMAMVNTTNNVKFEITRTTPHTFNFWKNYQSNKTTYAFTYPGNLIAHDYQPGYDQLVNDISTVVKDGNGGYAEYNVFDDGLITTYRRLQGAFQIKTLVGSAANATEADQQKSATARLLKDNTRLPRLLVISPRQGEIAPFDGWDFGDAFRVVLRDDSGTSNRLDAYLRVVGLNAVWSAQGGELLQLYMREQET
jgi:hypothetical protein